MLWFSNQLRLAPSVLVQRLVSRPSNKEGRHEGVLLEYSSLPILVCASMPNGVNLLSKHAYRSYLSRCLHMSRPTFQYTEILLFRHTLYTWIRSMGLQFLHTIHVLHNDFPFRAK